MVSFHFQRPSMKLPSRLLPPGKRRNFYTLSFGYRIGIGDTHRVKVFHRLHQVPSKAIGPVVPCRREQTDQVEVEGTVGGFLSHQPSSLVKTN